MSQFDDTNVSSNTPMPCGDSAYDLDITNSNGIEIELSFENSGEPCAGEEYCVTTPDGVEIRGYLNAQGGATVTGICEEGDCEITFPNLDQNAWDQ